MDSMHAQHLSLLPGVKQQLKARDCYRRVTARGTRRYLLCPRQLLSANSDRKRARASLVHLTCFIRTTTMKGQLSLPIVASYQLLRLLAPQTGVPQGQSTPELLLDRMQRTVDQNTSAVAAHLKASSLAFLHLVGRVLQGPPQQPQPADLPLS